MSVLLIDKAIVLYSIYLQIKRRVISAFYSVVYSFNYLLGILIKPNLKRQINLQNSDF